MKKKMGSLLLLLFTLLVVSLNNLTVFASNTITEDKSSVLRKVPLSEFAQEQIKIKSEPTKAVKSTVLRKTPLSESYEGRIPLKNIYNYYDPSNYPLVEPDNLAGYLMDTWGANHYVFFNTLEEAATVSDFILEFQIVSDNDTADYKDTYYSVEILKNNNDSLSFYSNYEYGIDETSNNWIVTASDAKSNFSDQEYIYIRIGIRDSYLNDYYNDTTLFKVSNPYFTPPDYIALNSFVTRLYKLCLDRDPDQVGLDFYVNGLATRTFTGASISNNFVFSSEFVTKNVSDEEFTNIMYRTFFDREGDSGGKTYWMDKLNNGMSRLYVLSCFVNSTEFSTICNNYGIDRGNILLTKAADMYPNVTGFVYRFYDRCLERKPDDSGLNYWVNQLVTGKSSGANLAYGFVFSNEFNGRKLSNTDFTRVMYSVFFNRESDTGGMTYWVNNLNGGMSRLQVFNGFVYSQEFSQICSNYGIKVR